MAQAFNNKKLRNDQKQVITFNAVASVPNFELWLLLHFENQLTPIHRDEVIKRLSYYLQGYQKGQGGHYQQTKDYYAVAKARAEHLATLTTAWDGTEPYTDVHVLVDKLIHLKTG